MEPSAAARRWPPIAAVGVALLMVFLVLPNPLRIPQQNPTASAEYAPVPGKTEQSTDGNFGEVGEATSPGIGEGGEGEGALPGNPFIDPAQFPKRDKSCVGNPPRQTEDPLSPPCVPFFDGENGGATFHGVTKDEITVIFYNGLGVEGDLSTPWKPSDEAAGHQSDFETYYLYRTIKGLLRYFQTRYQTYDRKVRLWGQDASGRDCPAQENDADIGVGEHTAFATVYLGDNDECYQEQMAKKYGVLSFGVNFDTKRSNYENYRPYIWGFFPDQETEAAYAASFICRTLYNGGKETARLAKDPTLSGRVRKFGFIKPVDSFRGPSSGEVSKLLESELKKQCPRTDTEYHRAHWFDSVDEYSASSTTAPSGAREAPGIMSKYKREFITTIMCYCIPVTPEGTVTAMQSQADSAGYFPEWYWDGQGSAMDRAIWDQTFAHPTQYGLGVSYLWRAPSFHQQYHYQAYQQEEPGTQPNVRFNFNIYHLFLNLFQAIQAAGPELTPETAERGMFTFHYLNRKNVYLPIGGYGAYSSSENNIKTVQAVSPYTFVETAMGWWYDPKGTPPGGRRGEGCIRLMNQGFRYFSGEWPLGDDALGLPSDPCTQDTRKLEDPQSSRGV